MILVSDNWKMVQAALTNGDRIALTGPPGTGKTYAAIHFGVGKKQKVYAITLDAGSLVQELRGTWSLQDGHMVWQDGPATLAARQGARLVINEIDRSSEDVLGFLYALCDSKETAMFTLPNGEVIQPAKGFTVVATMNGEFESLPEGLQSRFAIRVRVGQINPQALNALPQDLRGPAEASTDVDENRRISVREWQAYAMLRDQADMTSELALSLVFGERASEIQDTLSLTTSAD